MRLIVNSIQKTIHQRVILHDVSLQLESGKIYGFVGKNGSGKTMLFRAISGLMSVDSGEIWLDGKKLHRDFSVLPSMGIVLENAGLYPDKTGYENLKYLAGFRNCIGEKEIKEAIIRVGLSPDDKRNYRKYSMGMKQRLAIAQAIMEKPEILFLDEPTNALDDEGVVQIREMIEQERDRGAIILLASHIAEDIELLSDEIYGLKDGQVEKKR